MDKKIEKKTVLAANELIDYAADGIVSKEFLHTQGGSITLFAFDKGQKLSEHMAPFNAVLQIFDGQAQVMIEHQNFDLQAGQMIIIPKGALHAVSAVARFKMMLIMIRE